MTDWLTDNLESRDASASKKFFWATQFLLYPNTPIPPPIWKWLLTLAELFNWTPCLKRWWEGQGIVPSPNWQKVPQGEIILTSKLPIHIFSLEYTLYLFLWPLSLKTPFAWSLLFVGAATIHSWLRYDEVSDVAENHAQFASKILSPRSMR